MPDHDKYNAGSAGPRRFGEHKLHDKLRQLTSPDLRAGDILIAKEWSPHNKESFFIPLAQMLVSHHRGASGASEHVLLVVKDAEARTAEAVNHGVLISKGIQKRDHVVYGCTNEMLRWEVVKVACRLGGVQTGELDKDIYEAQKSPVNFRSRTGMPTVLFRRKNAGTGASQRVRQVYDFVYEGKALGDVRMVCSEFVTTCYEVAALRLTEKTHTRVTAFNVDPRAISAKALEGLLRAGTGPFRLSGRYRGALNYTKKQQKEAEAAIANMRIERAGFDQDHIPPAVLRAREANGSNGL
jgi:hypothetical protein